MKEKNRAIFKKVRQLSVIAPILSLIYLGLWKFVPDYLFLYFTLVVLFLLTLFSKIYIPILLLPIIVFCELTNSHSLSTHIARFSIIVFSIVIPEFSKIYWLKNYRRSLALKKLKEIEETSEHLASYNGNHDDILYTLLEAISFKLKSYSCILYELNKEKFVLKHAISGTNNSYKHEILPSEGIFGALYKSRKLVYFADVEGRTSSLNYYCEAPPIKSTVALTIIFKESVLGALILDKEDPFIPEDLELLKIFSKSVAGILSEKDKLTNYVRLKDEFEQFYNTSKELNKCLTLENILQVFLDSAKKITSFDIAFAILYNHHNNKNTIKALKGDFGSLLGKEYDCLPDKNLTSWVIKNKIPLDYTKLGENDRNIQILPPSFSFDYPMQCVYISPMLTGKSCVGCIFVTSKEKKEFSLNEKRMLEVIANQAAASINNAKIYQDMELMATIDGLTGLFNHRVFQENLSIALERSNRHQEKLSLIMADIDNFKLINDTYGHPVGDLILKNIGGIIQRVCRKIDFAARYGGEEIAVILPNTNEVGAKITAERLRKEISQNIFKSPAGGINVSLSFGIATFSTHAKTKEALIEKADKALYAAKHAGKNCAICYSDITEKEEENNKLDFSTDFQQNTSSKRELLS